MVRSSLVHYVEFFYPGSFFEETSVKKIKDRHSKITPPQECYGYRFFDITELKTGNERLEGKPKNYSKCTYFGRLMNSEDIKKELSNKKNLIKQIKDNNYKKLVETEFGQYIPFKSGDKVLPKREEVHFKIKYK